MTDTVIINPNTPDTVIVGPGSGGAVGPANTLAIGTVVTGTLASATITGTSPNQILNLVLPKGNTGTAATIAIGTVTTGAAGSSATVTNSGSSSAATFNFSIPQGIQGATGSNFTGYDYEIHVSQVDGNDTTGNGDLLTPVASITKALTLITGNRKTIIIHPGTYTESPSITTQYTTLTGPGLIGGNIVISGTVSTSVGCTISGLKITNLTVTAPTGTGNVNILNCEVSGTFTKSSNADYTVLRLCDFNAASITGAGLLAIFGGNPNFITVNNASANVIVKSAVTVAPVLTAGTLSLVDSVVGAAVTNAVTSAASSIITLANCQFLTSALTGVAPVVLNGFYSILNCVYDKPNSTLVASSGTGGSTNSVDYFQYINADKFITQGGTSSQFVKGDGSLDSTVNAATATNVAASGITGATLASNVTASSLTSFGSNATLTGKLIETISVLTGPATNTTLTLDTSAGTTFTVTFGAANISGLLLTNIPNGSTTITLILKQDGVGGRTISWGGTQVNGSATNATPKWSNGTAPTLSTAANAVDIITLVVNRTSGSTDNVYGFLAGKAFS